MTLINCKIYRSDSDEPATSFDMGDIEFVFDGQLVSSRGSSLLSNMIYVSLVDLIDGLLRLKGGGRNYEFVGADSSFIIHFNRNKKGIDIICEKRKYGPISINELLKAIYHGIDAFLADPRNQLSMDSSMHDDFNASWTALKNVARQNNF